MAIKFGISALTAIAVAAMATLGSASAATVNYNGYDVVNNQGVSISGPNNFNESGGSGQILLHTSAGTLPTWCVDLFDWLAGSGTYTLSNTPSNNGAPATPTTALSAAVAGRVGALMAYGNAHIGDSYDISAGTQIAIWETINPGYTFTSGAGAMGVAANLFTMPLEPVNYYTVLTSVNGAGAANNQELITAAPEPATLGLIGIGLLGLALVRRRRH